MKSVFARRILVLVVVLTVMAVAHGEVLLDQTLTLYQAPPESPTQTASPQDAERALLVERLRSGQFGSPEDYQTRARLRLKTDKRSMVVDARTLNLPPESTAIAPPWHRQEQLFFRHPLAAIPDASARTVSVLTLPLTTAGPAPAHLNDYNELWVDFAEATPLAACQPQIELDAIQRPYGQDPASEIRLLARTTQRQKLRLALQLDAARAEWRRKDYAYLAGRFLGLAPDPAWRYAQDGKNVVVQRRLRQDLDNMAALDIMLAGGAKLDRVNLRVSVDRENTAGELIEYETLSPGTPLEDGRIDQRIDLNKVLAARFPREIAENEKQPGRHQFYLQEIFVFLPGDEARIAAVKPLRGIAFWETADLTQPDTAQSAPIHRPIPLGSRVEALSATRRRLVVDLDPFTRNGESTLRQAQLLLAPADPGALCAIRLSGIHLVGAYQGNAPVFLGEIEALDRRWGGPFLSELPQDDQLEAVAIEGYLPFAAFTQPGQQSATGSEFSPRFSGTAVPQSLPAYSQATYRLRIPDAPPPAAPPVPTDFPQATLLLATGATLSAEAFGFQATTSGHDLIVQGHGGDLTLDWPLLAEVGPETRFILGSSSESEQLARAELTVTATDGATTSYLIIPNHAIKLGLPHTRLSRATLRLTPTHNPYRLALREAAFFTPTWLSFAQAYRFKLPFSTMLAPRPQDLLGETTAIVAQRGKLAGLLPGSGAREALSWNTPLAPALVWGRGIQLAYRLPWTRAPDDPCQLTLTLIGSKARLERELCLNNQAGRIFIPFADWLAGSTAPTDWGNLQAIRWVLRTSSDPAASAAPAIALDFAVEGLVSASAEERIRLASLFELGGEPVYAASEPTRVEAGQPSLSLRPWLPLTPEILGRLLATDGQLEQSDHPWFRLERIVAEPRPALPLERWLELIRQPDPPPSPPRWPKWLLLAAGGATLVWLWRKGWLRRGWRFGGRVLRSAGCWSLARLWSILSGVGCWLRRHQRWLHALIGLMALAGGVGAGRLGFSFAGGMLLLAALSTAAAAYQFWRRPAAERDGDPVTRLQNARVAQGVTLLGVILGAWALGREGLAATALWGWLPLLSAAYWRLDDWRDGVRRWLPKVAAFLTRRRRLCIFIAWTLATVALYGAGLTQLASPGENYYFTFGGMAAVLALRGLLLGCEPRLRQRLPAVAVYVYDGAGSLYFSGALAMLGCTALLLAIRLEPIAEQAAIVVYYCLVVGTVKEVIALRRQRVERDENADGRALPPVS